MGSLEILFSLVLLFLILATLFSYRKERKKSKICAIIAGILFLIGFGVCGYQVFSL